MEAEMIFSHTSLYIHGYVYNRHLRDTCPEDKRRVED
jgi:hypothetical protein